MPNFNLRAKSTNNNGASITYTWHDVACDNEEQAHALAQEWAEDADKQHKSPNPEFGFQTKSIETSLPSDETLQQETDEHIRDKMDLELMCNPQWYN